jgi:hypothetical protein
MPPKIGEVFERLSAGQRATAPYASQVGEVQIISVIILSVNLLIFSGCSPYDSLLFYSVVLRSPNLRFVRICLVCVCLRIYLVCVCAHIGVCFSALCAGFSSLQIREVVY